MNKIKHLFYRTVLPGANLTSKILPPTRLFIVRRLLYRLAGLQISTNVQIVGGAKFHYHTVSIGENTWVGTETHFFTSESSCIKIGKNVDIAPGCFFNTGTHENGNAERRAGKNITYPIIIGNGCWIGMGSTILGGAKIGNGCIIAAGAVVRGEFPDNVLIGGVPAKIIKNLEVD